MKIISSFSPLPGERVVGVHPTMAPEVDAGWRRRLNFYTGRSLSDVALTVEQNGRSGRLTTRGQMVSPGILSGLEAALDDTGENIYIAAGAGVAASGEDIFVPAARSIRIRSLPVYAPVELLAESGAGGPGPTGTQSTGALKPRRLGPSLGELIDRGTQLPKVGILVLQPLVVEMIGELDPEDPCEIDPQNDAFDDWQLAEGCRLIFYAWPSEWAALPQPYDRWRNRIAYTIFELERQYGPSEFLPWQEVGVPVGLVGFDDSWNPLFLDRYSVVRSGGKPRRRTPLIAHRGHPLLWQARIEQFAEQLAAAIGQGIPAEQLLSGFRYMAPAGLLPKDAISPRERLDNFFPSDYYVEALPVPLEQLDVVMESSASLAEFDTFTPDRVRVLVPTPQVWYEPNLLQTEELAPEFQRTIDEYISERGEWLQRRLDVRDKIGAIVKSITGEPVVYPDPDPEALGEVEPVGTGPLDPEEEDYGTFPVDEARQTITKIRAMEDLRARLRNSTPLKHETAVALNALPENFELPEPIRGRIRHDDTRNLLIVQGVLTESQRNELLQAITAVNGPDEMVSAASALYRRSQNDDLSKLDEQGLEDFIEFLEGKAKRADDKIDLGFLRVQTDIYRIRQLMLGAAAASRLTTSPALANIAKGESALTTRENLGDFLDSLKETSARFSPGSIEPSAATPPSGERAGVTSSFTLETVPLNLGQLGVVGNVVSRPTSAFELSALAKRVQIESFGGVLGAAAAPSTPDEVTQQGPIVGKTLDFRTVTVGDRLEQPPAAESKNYTVAGKYEVIKNLSELDIAVDDLQVPGFYAYEDNVLQMDQVTISQHDSTKTKQVPREVRHSFTEIIDHALYQQILGDQHDLDPINADEGAFFAAGVRALDHTVAALRSVEGRIQGYRNAIRLCQDTLKELNILLGKSDQRLAVIVDGLAEARHNLSVARALKAEEDERVKTVNQRRSEIINKYVPFLAYQRPRLSSLVADTPMPVRPINPDIAETDQPPCSGRRVTIPSELEAMIGLLRDAPVKWFPSLSKLLNKLDRVEVLTQTVHSAQIRAQAKYVIKQPPASMFTLSGTSVEKSMGQIYAAQQQVVAQDRLKIAQLNLTAFAGLSWQHVRTQAEEAISLGDLIDADHNRAAIIQTATQELSNISQALACLYTLFGEVLPIIRLDWAQRLSQYNAPVNLRNLSSLPRWGELEYLYRNEVQSIVDWLYQRVDARYSEATGMVGDLIRICVLLASHAPVNQIISGRLPEPATVKHGDLVKVDVSNRKIHVGMTALIYIQAEVVAQAIVDDLSSSQAAIRILQAKDASVRLPQGAQVQFGEEGAFSLNPMIQGGKAVPGGWNTPAIFP